MIMRLGEDRPPPRDLSFWEHHLPWPLLTVPQIVPEINSEPYLVIGRERAFVCLRGVDGASVHEGGKTKRNAQCRRNRQRVKIRMKDASEATGGLARVISDKHFIGNSCDRPGCYEMYQDSARSPHQRFCSWCCRRAVEQVRERERRWKERRAG